MRTHGVVAIARVFVLSLVPIALAYNLAHFIGYLLIQGQLIIPLASDPFGWGWNLLGTAGYRLDLELIGAKAVWYMSVVAIVLGHVASVYVAHVVSLGRPVGRAAALRGSVRHAGPDGHLHCEQPVDHRPAYRGAVASRLFANTAIGFASKSGLLA